MSELILPEGCKPGFVQGRKCKRFSDVIEMVGQLLYLRRLDGLKGVRAIKATGLVGIIYTAVPDPMYVKGTGAVAVLSCCPPAPGDQPMQIVLIPATILEAHDAWVAPPGFPDKAVSLLGD